jgi:hypothetical protein
MNLAVYIGLHTSCSTAARPSPEVKDPRYKRARVDIDWARGYDWHNPKRLPFFGRGAFSRHVIREVAMYARLRGGHPVWCAELKPACRLSAEFQCWFDPEQLQVGKHDILTEIAFYARPTSWHVIKRDTLGLQPPPATVIARTQFTPIRGPTIAFESFERVDAEPDKLYDDLL